MLASQFEKNLRMVLIEVVELVYGRYSLDSIIFLLDWYCLKRKQTCIAA